MEFKIQTIEKLFYYIVAYSYLLLPICFFFLGAKKKELVPVVIALYGIICFFFIYFYSDIPKDIRKYFKTSYTFFEYSVFTFIFWVSIRSNKTKKLILILSLFFLLFQLFYVFSGKVKRLDTIPIGIETILLLLYIIYFFYSFSKHINNNYIYNHFIFWAAVGILIYLGGSFFFFILIEHLSEEQVETFGTITYFAEIIKNILFSFALFIYSRHSFEKKENNLSSIPHLDMI